MLNLKIQELVNRKPSKWGNVSIKTFENNIRLLTTAVKKQDELLDNIKHLCEKNNSEFAKSILQLIQNDENEIL